MIGTDTRQWQIDFQTISFKEKYLDQLGEI